MPTLLNKHSSARRVFYPSFDGGLNLASSPEILAKNELREAVNVELAPLTGKLKVRGGLVWMGELSDVSRVSDSSEIMFEEAAQVQGSSIILLKFHEHSSTLDVRNLCVYDYQMLWRVKGALSGNGDISATIWDDVILIASGGKLQKLIKFGGWYEIETIENSPDTCRYVFVRSGRVGVVSDDDTLTFSYVGDCEQWDNDPDDESTGQFVEIGYKDGMNINAVIPLSKDLIIFKSPHKDPEQGIIWRLAGDFPNWVVVEAAHNTGTFTQRSVKVVGNDVFYIAGIGLSRLSSVMEYGEIKTAWPDRKVSNALTELITSSAELWHVPVKQQLWLVPSYNDDKIWVFDYSRGIWTNFVFPEMPYYASGAGNKIHLFIDNNIYELNEFYRHDEMRGGNEEITAKIKLGAILSSRQTLVKAAFATYEISPHGTAYLRVEGFKLPLKYRGTPNYAYGADYCAYTAYDNVFPEKDDIMTSRAYCMVRDWVINSEVEITGGGFSISTIGLETAEV